MSTSPLIKAERERTMILLMVIVAFAAIVWGSVRITDSLQPAHRIPVQTR